MGESAEIGTSARLHVFKMCLRGPLDAIGTEPFSAHFPGNNCVLTLKVSPILGMLILE